MRWIAIRQWFAGCALLTLIALPRSAAAVPPADGWLIWESNRLDARPEIYRAHADGTEVVRLTQTGGILPLWAPDGRWIAFQDEAQTGYLMRPDGSGIQTLTVGPPWFWLHDNSGVVINQGGNLVLLDPETLETTPLVNVADFPRAAQTIKIKNSGGGSLGLAVVTTDPAASWLDVQTDGVSTITFALNNDAITSGIHQTTVTVTVDGALGSPASIPVTLSADRTFPIPDGGLPVDDEADGGSLVDGGTTDRAIADGGCGCAVGSARQANALLLLLGLAALTLARGRLKKR